MSKQEYLNTLRKELNGIPKSEIDEIIFDYEEHFNAGKNDGREEEEIAQSLGNPKTLAKELRLNYRITVVNNDHSVGNVFRAIFAFIGLGFFNLVFMFGPFMALVAVLFSILVSGFAIVISGIAVVIGGFFQPYYPEFINLPSNMVINILIGIGLASLGIMIIIIFKALFQLVLKLTIKYLNLNLSIITNRREKHENI